MASSRVVSSLVPLLHSYHRLGLPPTLASYTLLLHPQISRGLATSPLHFPQRTGILPTDAKHPISFRSKLSTTALPALAPTPPQHLTTSHSTLFPRAFNVASGIQVHRGINKESLNVKNWKFWAGKPSIQIWTFDKTEVALIGGGCMTLIPTNGKAIEVKPGDVVFFLKGSACQAVIPEGGVEKLFTEDPKDIAQAQIAIATQEQQSYRKITLG